MFLFILEKYFNFFCVMDTLAINNFQVKTIIKCKLNKMREINYSFNTNKECFKLYELACFYGKSLFKF